MLTKYNLYDNMVISTRKRGYKMTREEAIKILKEIEIPVNGDNEEERNMAFSMAIEALEQETVSKESYDHEYFLRKEFEIKIYKLQCKLDEVRTEIERQEKWLMDTGYNACSVDIAFDAIKSVIAEMENI